ncbi:MAG: ABC transporter permease [Lachnospiraceae bacterium]|nr:ABC transporter permease [Lachnospiraceae bacterium]
MEEETRREEAQTTEYSLSDDRRVKTLSPGAMVLKRFMRNRTAVAGIVILVCMFLFSYAGGVISPYTETEIFYRYEGQNKRYATVTENTELRFVSDGSFSSRAQAQFILARTKKEETFTAGDVTYRFEEAGDNFFRIYEEGAEAPCACASVDVVSSSTGTEKVPFALQYGALNAKAEGETAFTADGKPYELGADGTVTAGGEEVAYVGRYIVNPAMNDVFLTRGFKEALVSEIGAGATEFRFTDEDGTEAVYTVEYDAQKKSYGVLQETETYVFDSYHVPDKDHWLGTDRNGMDMLTRLMYGGRVSLYIGFIVVIIETVLGVILGGIAGYFGKGPDFVIMRVVDVLYCIPSIPVYIIFGAAMDAMRMDPSLRMVYLMLLLGLLGWPSIARLVRGQILSLREQEFMTAAEATGVRVSRRIFKHLIPNVIPQLIVTATMSLGNVILIEATLSFLGLGVKFPFASWGNIINDVTDTYVLRNYWFIWIPAGICLLLTVVAFNLVGDGLRDAFDPKQNR